MSNNKPVDQDDFQQAKKTVYQNVLKENEDQDGLFSLLNSYATRGIINFLAPLRKTLRPTARLEAEEKIDSINLAELRPAPFQMSAKNKPPVKAATEEKPIKETPTISSIKEEAVAEKTSERIDFSGYKGADIPKETGSVIHPDTSLARSASLEEVIVEKPVIPEKKAPVLTDIKSEQKQERIIKQQAPEIQIDQDQKEPAVDLSETDVKTKDATDIDARFKERQQKIQDIFKKDQTTFSA